MRKRILSFFLAMALVIGLIPAPAQAAEVTASGICGENVTWALDESTGTLTISGEGPMTDYGRDNPEPWADYQDIIRTVVIEEGVTRVSNSGFSGYSALTSVTLPEGLLEIGELAFYSCSGLTAINLPEGLTSIGTSALNATGLVHVEIPDSVTTLGESAFAHCASLESLKLPAGLIRANNLCFYNCTALKDVTMPWMENVESFSDGFFMNCTSLTDISFYNAAFTDSNMFSDCTGLVNVVIPDVVKNLGEAGWSFAFKNCDNLQSVTIPASVELIGECSFPDLEALTEVHFLGSAPTFGGSSAFRGVTATCYYPAGDASWTEEVRQNYGGTLTWVAVSSDGEHTHSYTSVTTAPTCTADGYTTYTCECGDTYTGNPVAATGHAWGEWVIVTEPTTEAEGLQERTCSTCGEKESQVIDKIPEPEEHPITVSIRTGSGTYVLSKPSAKAGDELTLTLSPDDGYRTEAVNFLCDGSGLNYESTDGVIYHITMPDSPLHIEIDFLRVYNVYLYYDTSLCIVSAEPGTLAEGESFVLTVEPYPGIRITQIKTYSYGTYAATGESCGENSWLVTMPDGDVEIYVTTVSDQNPFVDVKESDYFYDPVIWAATYGITTGVDATHFAPLRNCSRAEVVTFLWRAVGEPEPTTSTNPFSDVVEGSYYYKAVLWAVENGITTGTGNGKFSPNKSCSRAEVVTFLWRTCGTPNPSSYNNPFSDVPANTYYTDAVLWAVEWGITTGTGNGKFSPTAVCTRSQIVTFLYRTLA